MPRKYKKRVSRKNAVLDDNNISIHTWRKIVKKDFTKLSNQKNSKFNQHLYFIYRELHEGPNLKWQKLQKLFTNRFVSRKIFSQFCLGKFISTIRNGDQ